MRTTNGVKMPYQAKKSFFFENQEVMNTPPQRPNGLAVGQALNIDSKNYNSISDASSEMNEKLKQKQ